MKYTSTRGGVSGLSFEEALFSGYAPDGGLFFPERIPQIDAQTLKGWREAKIEGKLTYPQIVTQVVRHFVTPDEIPDDILEQTVSRAYQTFSHSQVINIHSLTRSKEEEKEEEDKDVEQKRNSQASNSHSHHDDGSSSASASPSSLSSSSNLLRGNQPASGTKIGKGDRTVKIAELYHGRTKSFKDLALSLVGQFMEYFVNKRKSHVTILIGTSGDTGSAAIDSVRGLTGVDIIVLYPKGKVSRVQELQMVTALETNVHIFEVEGTSDDLDIPIKQAFPQAGLTSCNSINWARIMIQIAHYVYIYVLEGTEVDVIVPTGAAGNLIGGIIAHEMGIPIRLYVATNENDCLDLMLRDGVIKSGGDVLQTPASAMDIAVPYNIERIFYLFSNGNSQLISGLMDKLEVEPVKLPEEIDKRLKSVVRDSMSVDRNLIFKTVVNCWEQYKYMICPHTATGLALFNELLASQPSKNPVYILSTASPHKFPESASDAGVFPDVWDGNALLTLLESQPTRTVKSMKQGQNWLQILQDEINSIKYSRQ